MIRTSFCGYSNQTKQSADEKKTIFLFLLEKNENHTISIYESCMTSIFLMVTTKIFLSKIEFVPICG